MANLNQVFLIGRLTRDPELRYVPSGKAVANLGLATSRVFTTHSSGRKEGRGLFCSDSSLGKTGREL
ncbi:MAG: single-stranded DNA-binding protein [Nitrospirae bacterium]|nr:single-stranded DNA-binding protein [Nitrospirota bacterium]